MSLNSPSLILESSWFKLDRKSTRLNSSHSQISYAVFCLKKKKKKKATNYRHPHSTSPLHEDLGPYCSACSPLCSTSQTERSCTQHTSHSVPRDIAARETQ